MRFRTRAFLICFVPFALLFTVSFWMIQRSVQSTVRDDLRASMRRTQLEIARIHSKSDLQNSRFLRVAGDNAALRAGIQLLLFEPGSVEAKSTVEDQLRELGEHMGFDYLLVSAPDGTPLAGVIRRAAEMSGASGELVPLDLATIRLSDKGLALINGQTLQVASLPIDQNGQENIGTLAVGEHFNFSEFTTPAVLMHNGRVTESNLPAVPLPEIDTALSLCPEQMECDIRLRDASWVSLPMQSFGGGYLLRSLGDVDLATAPLRSKLRTLFLTVALGAVLVGLVSSIASSHSIVKPIAALVAHLRAGESSGELQEFRGDESSILEVRELAETYNRAAVSVRRAGDSLQRAYFEFVGSLANALDARDGCTSGHSWRVSQLSSATAAAMALAHDHVERIRIGGLLHDVGKIGVADSVLQKPGRLTAEEFDQIKEHPVIGRRILEGVQGLAPYLDAVELHHENWDGTGYPKGQIGEQTPVDARIIHVSDAYDSMTTDRPYRRGMTHETALGILYEYAGTQFDPGVVEVFTKLPREIVTGKLDVSNPAKPFETGEDFMKKTLVVCTLFGLIGVGLLGSPSLFAQEASSGVDLRATLNGQTLASSISTEDPRFGSPVTAGFRGVLYPMWKLNDRWSVNGAVQLYTRPYFYESLSAEGHGANGNVLQATVSYTRVGDRGSFMLRAGQMPTAFGSFMLHYDDAENALIDIPIGYGYYDAPVSTLASGAAQVDVTRAKWDGRLQIANSSPAETRSLLGHDQYLNWVGGGGYTIRQGFRVGVSGYHGPDLDGTDPYFMSLRGNSSALVASAVGLDAAWARGPWNLQGELQRFRLPGSSPLQRVSKQVGYAEVKRVLNPRWYVAARGGYKSERDADVVQNLEAAATFRPARYQLIKMGYQLQHHNEGPNFFEHTVGVQVVTTFHLSAAH